MKVIIRQFAIYMKQFDLPKVLVINGIKFDVEKGTEYAMNNQHGTLCSENFLQRRQEYTLINQEYKINIPIAMQLYLNEKNHYRLFVYTKGNKMLTSINLTTNREDNKIELNIPIKLSTQKIDGRFISKEERVWYRDELIKYIKKEGIEIEGRIAYLGTYSTSLQRITYPTGEKFLENFIKLAILKGHFSTNKFLPNIEVKYFGESSSISVDKSDQDIKNVINYLKEYHGKKYIQTEKLTNEEVKNEMIEFRQRGRNARKQLLDIANKVIADPEFSDYEISKRLDWINQAQNGCNYFWIEFKKKDFKESPSSISLVVSVEEYYPTFVALSVEAKDGKCKEEDYRKHNRLISRDLPNNDVYYVTTTFKNDSHLIQKLSRKEIIKKYRNGEIKKIKLQMDIDEPYTDLTSRLRAGIKVLQPYYLLSVSDELGDGYEVLEDDEVYYEGSITTVKVNKYERNDEARRKCIEIHGCQCKICGFDFEKTYGEAGKGLIHVHHVVPISTIKEEYQIDYMKDLVPVCPNCHAMIHRKKDPYAIEEIKAFINSNK